MSRMGTYFKQTWGNHFIYIDDIHNKDNIEFIIDYMRKTKNLEFDCLYNEDGSKIYFNCISCLYPEVNKKYNFILSNNSYLLMEWNTYDVTFKVVSFEDFNKDYFEGE